MVGIIAATNLGGAGLAHSLIRKSMKTGERTQESKDMERERRAEILVKSIPEIYDVKGKLIEYDSHGRHLDMKH